MPADWQPAPGATPRFLVVIPSRIGDVLLTTPFLRSLKQHWPYCQLDVAVFAGTQGVLEGNKDVDQIIILPRHHTAYRPALLQTLRYWRRYTVAFAARDNDRGFWWARLAGQRCVALRPAQRNHSSDLLGRLATLAVPFDEHAPRIDAVLAIAKALDIMPHPAVIPPQPDLAAQAHLANLLPQALATYPYVVIHPQPMFRYKQWHAAGWRGLIQAIHQRGLAVCISGGPDLAETQALDRLLQGLTGPIHRLDGSLSFAQLAQLLRHAQAYIGPDTVSTHLAAACGTPAVALFGPTDPVRWGPQPLVPADEVPAASPPGLISYQMRASVQHQHNVWLIQNSELSCVPCHQEGCARHSDSSSLCLQTLPLKPVLEALDSALKSIR